jgi:glyoxylase-like metal-dependent hydrolase (beta-lactamase superfamily II)
MKIHHLNAGTMCPASARLVNGSGGLFSRARLVCHLLLMETSKGLVLVDTGLGLGDIAKPSRLGLGWVKNTCPVLDHEETAIEQVKRLGFSPSDVRHILLTHLDRDHAGGILDFPGAQAHVHANEYRAAITGEVAVREGRYIKEQMRDRSGWVLYGEEGEDWFGFKGVRALNDHEAEILIIPLFGHTPGHCGVAVRAEDGWILHAGDSYYFHGQIETPACRAPLALSFFQRKGDTDRAQRVANQERLRELNARHGDEVTIINSHDPHCFDACCSH